MIWIIFTKPHKEILQSTSQDFNDRKRTIKIEALIQRGVVLYKSVNRSNYTNSEYYLKIENYMNKFVTISMK